MATTASSSPSSGEAPHTHTQRRRAQRDGIVAWRARRVRRARQRGQCEGLRSSRAVRRVRSDGLPYALAAAVSSPTWGTDLAGRYLILKARRAPARPLRPLPPRICCHARAHSLLRLPPPRLRPPVWGRSHERSCRACVVLRLCSRLACSHRAPSRCTCTETGTSAPWPRLWMRVRRPDSERLVISEV